MKINDELELKFLWYETVVVAKTIVGKKYI